MNIIPNIDTDKRISEHCGCRAWRFLVGACKFASLFLAPEIWRLLAVFALTWLVCFFVHCVGGESWVSTLQESFRSLFSLSTGVLPIWKQIALGLCFFVVWLIGGGILVSVMVAQQRRNDNGEFRLPSRLLRGHVVFFGWDENVPALMRKELQDGENGSKKIFVLVTMSDVDDVAKAVEASDIEEWRLLVYRGFYDDDSERTFLNLANASAIYIMGECREEAHDSRVVLLAKNMRSLVKDDGIPVYANISDFGLASRLKSDKRKNSLSGVECINFHLDSAAAMLNRIWGEKPFGRIAVLGFGAMGKAVVVKALEMNLPLKRPIYVSDDDEGKLEMEKARFDKHFPEYVDAVQKCSYSEWLAVLHKAGEGEEWLVVIAKHRSEKGLGIVWDVISAIDGKSNFRLALNQEVKCDLRCDEGAMQDSIEIGGRRIELFGFRRGDMRTFS